MMFHGEKERLILHPSLLRDQQTIILLEFQEVKKDKLFLAKIRNNHQATSPQHAKLIINQNFSSCFFNCSRVFINVKYHMVLC